MVGLLLTAMLWFQAPAAGVSPGFLVIVNAENPAASLPREEVERMFTKRIVRWERWPGQPRVDPVDQRYSAPVREVFTREIHGKNPARIRSYWNRLIFSGRGAPPPERDSDEDVVDFVLKNRGAIGYVSARASLPRGVRAVTITQEP
jgi:ABC-type phosphate transport system substrate-binding protein